jgi:20S proteasome subunit beta 1
VYNIPVGGGLFKAKWAIGGPSSPILLFAFKACLMTLNREWFDIHLWILRLDVARGNGETGHCRLCSQRSVNFFFFLPFLNRPPDLSVDLDNTALALAMSRDGSSGGTIRMVIIDKEGVERVFVPGTELPNFDGYVVAGEKRGMEKPAAK